MIKIILVPLDGSDSSAEALDTALVVAGRFNAHIKAVHVVTKIAQQQESEERQRGTTGGGRITREAGVIQEDRRKAYYEDRSFPPNV